MKKIKYLVYLLPCLLCGCEYPSTSSQLVTEKYGAEVREVPGSYWRFIARDTNGAIFYVETSRPAHPDQVEISNEVKLFNPLKN